MNEMPGGQMPGGQMKNRLGSDSATMSELIPLMGEKKNLLKKGHLIVASIILVYAIVLLANLDNPDLFRTLFGIGIGVGVYSALYSMCGKKKAWYGLAGATVITVIVMSSPLWELLYTIFYGITGNLKGDDPTSLPQLLLLRIVSTGGVEEFVKILPVLLFWSLSKKIPKLSVTEPLDGILFAMASALGFVFIETLGQYANNAVKQAGQIAGLELVIVRILWAFKGHLAYSGYFGYFVGLAAMKPKHAIKLVAIGYACSAIMHGFWDSFVGLGVFAQLVLGVVFYALLIAAVLKAREISPTRQQNFATVLVGSPAAVSPLVNQAAANASGPPMPQPYTPAMPQPYTPPPPPPAFRPQPVAQPPGPGPYRPPAPQPQPYVPPQPQPYVPPQPPARPQPIAQPQYAPTAPVAYPAGSNGFRLIVGLRTLTLPDGGQFRSGEIAGLVPASADGLVAAVNHNPKDPSMLGLQNLSTSPWRAVLPGGEVRDVPPGKSVKLASGSRIDFGTSQGEVQ